MEKIWMFVTSSSCWWTINFFWISVFRTFLCNWFLYKFFVLQIFYHISFLFIQFLFYLFNVLFTIYRFCGIKLIQYMIYQIFRIWSRSYFKTLKFVFLWIEFWLEIFVNWIVNALNLSLHNKWIRICHSIITIHNNVSKQNFPCLCLQISIYLICYQNVR